MLLLKLGMLLCYLHISALATTDVLRLLSGSTVSVFDARCYCSACGHKIPLWHQIPIVSYIINRGKCPYCTQSIEPMNFYLEIFSFIGYLLLMMLFRFKPLGVLVSFLLYETVKLCVVAVRGRKKTAFLKEYSLSLVTNALIFALVGFLAIVHNFTATGHVLT